MKATQNVTPRAEALTIYDVTPHLFALRDLAIMLSEEDDSSRRGALTNAIVQLASIAGLKAALVAARLDESYLTIGGIEEWLLLELDPETLDPPVEEARRPRLHGVDA